MRSPLARLASNDLLSSAQVGRADHATRQERATLKHFTTSDGSRIARACETSDEKQMIFAFTRFQIAAMDNGGVDAAARIQSSIAGRIMMRNTLPPLASNDLLCGAMRCTRDYADG